MKNFCSHLLVIILFTSLLYSGCQPDASKLSVLDDSSPEAEELLQYLYSLKGEKTLSGQHNYSHELTASHDSVKKITGKLPALYGSDFIGRRYREEMIKEVIERHRAGSLITLMYHQPRPYADSLGGFRDSISHAEWQQLVTPGTPIHQTWLNDIDSVAYYLQKLEEKNIPVLWRPYHEMNGIWFWWCNKRGEDGIKKLWKMMFDRYTNHHKLQNLIWVWNANAPRIVENDTAYAYHLFYPGGKYVDVLAADVYKGDWKKSHHDQLLELAGEKPIAIGECGKLPPPDIFEEQPQWTWFMVWARYIWRANEPDRVKDIYSLPRIITLDEVARLHE